ncbi:CsbD family protein [Pendulispora brunnea]|uniref:CsbD family protein n=1 Tax=Pendulispora brunnea TaxID=2905690 RepID=A0ABZ2KCP5_9BACT
MNWDSLKGDWKILKGQVRQKWGKLTDDDLEQIAGQREEFLGRLQQRYGYKKDEAEQQVNDWLKTVNR